jgi:hypothetical protein
MLVEMENDYYQEGFGTVLDFVKILHFIDGPKLYGYICLLKMDTGKYGVARHGLSSNWGFDNPYIFLSNYDAASTYWEGHKQAILRLQEAEKTDYMNRVHSVEIKN